MTDDELDRLVRELSNGVEVHAMPWIIDRLVAEVERLKAEVAARDALEAWRLADPAVRWYRVEVRLPYCDADVETVHVLLYEYRTVQAVNAYDRDQPEVNGHLLHPRDRVFAGHRCGVNAVIAAALARWRELYEGGVT